MNESLRDEINNYIVDIHSTHDPDDEPNPCDVNIIMNMIEKRIDERINEFKVIKKTDYSNGLIQGLYEVKGMLK